MYPTKNIIEDDDDKTVITSNIIRSHKLCGIITQPRKQAILPTHAVADTGATLVFVLKETKLKNIRPAVTPLVINLPDGTVVRLTHIWYYIIYPAYPRI